MATRMKVETKLYEEHMWASARTIVQTKKRDSSCTAEDCPFPKLSNGADGCSMAHGQ